MVHFPSGNDLSLRPLDSAVDAKIFWIGGHNTSIIQCATWITGTSGTNRAKEH